MVDTEGHDELEARVGRPVEIVHSPDAHAPLRLLVAQMGCETAARLCDHRLRGVHRANIEASSSQEIGVAPAGAAEIEHANDARVGKARDEPHEAQVRLARGEACDVFRGFPEVVHGAGLATFRTARLYFHARLVIWRGALGRETLW